MSVLPRSIDTVTIHESVSVCSFSVMVRCIPTPSHNVPFSLFNTVYIGMVTHEKTEGQCSVII